MASKKEPCKEREILEGKINTLVNDYMSEIEKGSDFAVIPTDKILSSVLDAIEKKKFTVYIPNDELNKEFDVCTEVLFDDIKELLGGNDGK